MENLPPFLTIRQKAAQAEWQKFLLPIATWIQAFLVMYLTQESIYQMMHLQRQATHWVA
jgi:hypothetical protein